LPGRGDAQGGCGAYERNQCACLHDDVILYGIFILGPRLV
jgi:hypothetical protein